MTLSIKVSLRSLISGAIIFVACVLFQSSYSRAFSQVSQPVAQDKPFVVEYYYKAKWGYASEFLRLFKKNHYPYLKKQMENGKILQLTAESPINHATEDGRWDYRVRIVWKNVWAAHDDSGDDQIRKLLFPDQETFNREEQRRFEILIAHWDVPVKTVELVDK